MQLTRTKLKIFKNSWWTKRTSSLKPRMSFIKFSKPRLKLSEGIKRDQNQIPQETSCNQMLNKPVQEFAKHISKLKNRTQLSPENQQERDLKKRSWAPFKNWTQNGKKRCIHNTSNLFQQTTQTSLKTGSWIFNLLPPRMTNRSKLKESFKHIYAWFREPFLHQTTIRCHL